MAKKKTATPKKAPEAAAAETPPAEEKAAEAVLPPGATLKSRPDLGKVFVWDLEHEGVKYERWPVDARAMVSGYPERYSTVPPGGGPDALEPRALPGGGGSAGPREHSPGVPLNATPATGGETPPAAGPLPLPPGAAGSSKSIKVEPSK